MRRRLEAGTAVGKCPAGEPGARFAAAMKAAQGFPLRGSAVTVPIESLNGPSNDRETTDGKDVRDDGRAAALTGVLVGFVGARDGAISRPPHQDDRAMGRGRRYRQHLPAVRHRIPEASRPNRGRCQCRRRIRHRRRARGQGCGARRLYGLCGARLYPSDLLRGHQRRQIQRLRADLPGRRRRPRC